MVVDSLKVLLGSVFITYLKAQSFHWNVTGPMFHQFHLFFEKFYSDLHSSVDDIAEEIRKYDAFAPLSCTRLLELSEVKEEDSIPETLEMIIALKYDNEVILKVLYRCRKEADAVGKNGTVNYIEERITQHEKWAWMLTSFVR